MIFPPHTPVSKNAAVRFRSLLALDRLRNFRFWRDYWLALLFIVIALLLSLYFLELWPVGKEKVRGDGEVTAVGQCGGAAGVYAS